MMFGSPKNASTPNNRNFSKSTTTLAKNKGDTVPEKANLIFRKGQASQSPSPIHGAKAYMSETANLKNPYKRLFEPK